MRVKIGGINVIRHYSSLTEVVKLWEVIPGKKLYVFKYWVMKSWIVFTKYFQLSALQSHNRITLLPCFEVSHSRMSTLLWPMKNEQKLCVSLPGRSFRCYCPDHHMPFLVLWDCGSKYRGPEWLRWVEAPADRQRTIV